MNFNLFLFIILIKSLIFLIIFHIFKDFIYKIFEFIIINQIFRSSLLMLNQLHKFLSMLYLNEKAIN